MTNQNTNQSNAAGKLELRPSAEGRFINVAIRQSAILIKQSIEKGYCPMLPNKKGVVMGQPILNAGTGFVLFGKDLITAQIKARQENHLGNVVGSLSAAQRAETQIKPDAKGIYSHYKYKDKKTGEEKNGNMTLYFGDQMKHPERLDKLANETNREDASLRDEKFRASTVEEYLPTYLAACKNGAKMEVAPEVAEQFKERMLSICNNELEPSKNKFNSDIPRLGEVMFNADTKARELIKSIKAARANEKSQVQNLAGQALAAATIEKPHRKIEHSMER